MTLKGWRRRVSSTGMNGSLHKKQMSDRIEAHIQDREDTNVY